MPEYDVSIKWKCPLCKQYHESAYAVFDTPHLKCPVTENVLHNFGIFQEATSKLVEIQQGITYINERAKMIMSIEREKGRNSSRYSIRPELRKTTLKDARADAEIIFKQIQHMAKIIDDFMEDDF